MEKKIRKYAIFLLSFSMLTVGFYDPITVFAETAGNDSQERLIDSRKAAEYLLSNKQELVLKREPVKETTAEFPEKFDLRELGYVTPVKQQSPWGTCWGFSIIAASESSILAEMGKTYEETGLDLSEHHLAYFARTCMNDGSSQDGEGIYLYDEADRFNTGGYPFTGTSVFSSGMGVVTERIVPYRGKNSETESSLIFNACYSPSDDWSIPDEFKFVQSYELENSDILPSPAVYEAGLDSFDESDVEKREKAYLGYDQSATDLMKQALMDGKAISIGYASDTYLPGISLSGEPLYINTENNQWTHYTYDGGTLNHAVTIVGWDDTIKSTDFLDHTNDLYGDGLPHQPEGDGAWIVKNSWGAEVEDFPNSNFAGWGIENENGQGTGYFYLSYYDRSIAGAEVFDFDTEGLRDKGYIIDQYDYLQTGMPSGWADKNELRTANVFTAEFDEALSALSCETEAEDTDVSYEVFLLSDDAETPADGELVLTAGEHYAHAGYHRLKLKDTVKMKKGQKYSVIVTQLIKNNGENYYGVPIVSGFSKEWTDTYNRRMLAGGTGMTQSYYSRGVVNPGESYVYIGQMNGWSDFSEIIPVLKKHEDFEGYEFDNFPIKAYLEYTDEADMTAAEAYTPPELGYAEPATMWNHSVIIRWLFSLMAVIVLIVLVIRHLIRNRRRKKLIKAQQAEIDALKAKLSEVEVKFPVNESSK